MAVPRSNHQAYRQVQVLSKEDQREGQAVRQLHQLAGREGGDDIRQLAGSLLSARVPGSADLGPLDTIVTVYPWAMR